MRSDLEARVRDVALPYYDDALPAHDRFHARRVRDLSVRLADECSATVDRDVLTAAAWLHDIGRPRERTGDVDDHGDWAADKAADLLADAPATAEQVAAIEHCLRAHSIRPSSPEPASVEAELLFDADKLDAAGARGLLRLACIVGERSGRTGERYAVIDDPAAIDDASALDAEPSDDPDVSLLREWARERLDALQTDPGRRLGETRWAFMEAFFDRFEAERGVDESV